MTRDIYGYVNPDGTARGNWFYCASCKVRHPRIHQARRVDPETWGTVIRRNWPEIVGGVFVLLLSWGVLAYVLPVLAEAAK